MVPVKIAFGFASRLLGPRSIPHALIETARGLWYSAPPTQVRITQIWALRETHVVRLNGDNRREKQPRAANGS